MDLGFFQEQIDYRFQNEGLLTQALTHPSAARKLKDNQRLEFLGDAVLQMSLSIHLYESFPRWAEGKLTELRAAAVNRTTLSQIARAIDLGHFLILGRGEKKNRGADKDSNLADAFEALIGAIYLDSDFTTAREWTVRQYHEHGLLDGEQTANFNPKGDLQEQLQAKGLPTPEYEVIEESGPDHSKEYTVIALCDGKELGRGSGASKKTAEQEAARAALDKIG
jgi:ribonuclease-3